MEDLKTIYLQILAVRDDLPEETREYVESELEKEENNEPTDFTISISQR